MRTIRTKVYQFSELSLPAKLTATKNEVDKFRLYFGTQTEGYKPGELKAAKERLLQSKHEFKADGTRF